MKGMEGPLMRALKAPSRWARRHPLLAAMAMTAFVMGGYVVIFRDSPPEDHAFQPAFLIVSTLGLFLLWWLDFWLASRAESARLTGVCGAGLAYLEVLAF